MSKKQKRSESTINADRISGLPEPLIHQILSRLPTGDATRTSALSKIFYSSWNSFSVVDLDYEFIKTSSSKGYSTQEFTDLVKRSLDHRNLIKDLCIKFHVKGFMSLLPRTNFADLGSITKLYLAHLEMNFNRIDAHLPLLESLTIITCRGLKHFNFFSSRIKSITVNRCDGLQSVVIESSSLETFCLHQYECKIIDVSECKSLKDLVLSVGDMEDSWIEDNLESFPHLEKLVLSECISLINPRIVNENLRSLLVSSVWGSEIPSIDISAKNLQSLSLDIEGASNIRIDFFKYLRDVTLDNCLPMEFVKEFVKDQIPKFIRLKNLKINTYEDLNGIEINNKHLRRLVLADCSSWYHRDFEGEEFGWITLNTPKLASFEYSGFIKTFRGMSFEDLVNAKLEIERCSRKEYFVNLWNLIQTFGHVKDLKLSFRWDEDLIFSRKLRRKLVAPICNRNHVELE